MEKYKNIFQGRNYITLRVAQIVITEQLQYYIP